MKTFKNLTLILLTTIAAIFVIALSLASFGFRSPVSALAVNWFGLAWTATVTLLAHLSFSASYYQARHFEQTGQFYERMGIRLVKEFLRRGPLKILSPTLKFPKEKTVAALWNLENEMRKAETAHVLTFILMLFPVGYAAVNGWIDALMWMSLFNILFNIYPIMLQRYNRIKLLRLMSITR